MATKRRKRPLTHLRDHFTVAPPDCSGSWSGAHSFVHREFGACAAELIHYANAARLRTKLLTEPHVAAMDAGDLVFATHPVHSTIEALEVVDSVLCRLGEWNPVPLRRAGAALRRATELGACLPPAWVFELETQFDELSRKASFLRADVQRRLDGLRETAGEVPIAAERRSRERLAIANEANAIAAKYGRALKLEHLVALEIVCGARGTAGEARDQAEHDNRVRQWRQLLKRHSVSLENGSGHPNRVEAAERKLEALGHLQAAKELFRILTKDARIRPCDYGSMLERILAVGLAGALSEWNASPAVVPLGTVGF